MWAGLAPLETPTEDPCQASPASRGSSILGGPGPVDASLRSLLRLHRAFSLVVSSAVSPRTPVTGFRAHPNAGQFLSRSLFYLHRRRPFPQMRSFSETPELGLQHTVWGPLSRQCPAESTADPGAAVEGGAGPPGPPWVDWPGSRWGGPAGSWGCFHLRPHLPARKGASSGAKVTE